METRKDDKDWQKKPNGEEQKRKPEASKDKDKEKQKAEQDELLRKLEEYGDKQRRGSRLEGVNSSPGVKPMRLKPQKKELTPEQIREKKINELIWQDVNKKKKLLVDSDNACQTYTSYMEAFQAYDDNYVKAANEMETKLKSEIDNLKSKLKITDEKDIVKVNETLSKLIEQDPTKKGIVKHYIVLVGLLDQFHKSRQGFNDIKLKIKGNALVHQQRISQKSEIKSKTDLPKKYISRIQDKQEKTKTSSNVKAPGEISTKQKLALLGRRVIENITGELEKKIINMVTKEYPKALAKAIDDLKILNTSYNLFIDSVDNLKALTEADAKLLCDQAKAKKKANIVDAERKLAGLKKEDLKQRRYSDEFTNLSFSASSNSLFTKTKEEDKEDAKDKNEKEDKKESDEKKKDGKRK